MPFAAFMSLALYHHRHGYYASGRERTGWAGHFVTSAEVGPAFGELWAEGFRQVWEACAKPSPFTVVEIGPGEATFAEAVLSAVTPPFDEALAYRLVERMPRLEERQRARLGRFPRVSWSPSIAEVPAVGAGCVFANEVLDNLPVHLAEMSGRELREVCVDARDGRLVFTLRPPSTPHLPTFLTRTGVSPAEGHRYEITLAAESFTARAAAVLDTGAVIFVDYGDDAAALAARPGGSLVSYSAAGVDTDVLAAPGERDITAHANWTAVAGALAAAGLGVYGPISQRSVLHALGLGGLDERLAREHREAAAAGAGGTAVRALSLRQSLGVLADPGGLGTLGVLAGLKRIPRPPFLTA